MTRDASLPRPLRRPRPVTRAPSRQRAAITPSPQSYVRSKSLDDTAGTGPHLVFPVQGLAKTFVCPHTPARGRCGRWETPYKAQFGFRKLVLSHWICRRHEHVGRGRGFGSIMRGDRVVEHVAVALLRATTARPRPSGATRNTDSAVASSLSSPPSFARIFIPGQAPSHTLFQPRIHRNAARLYLLPISQTKKQKSPEPKARFSL